jgi:hypothetical protein
MIFGRSDAGLPGNGPQCRSALHDRWRCDPLRKRPGKPPRWRIVVDSEGDSGPPAGLPDQPGRIQSYQDAPTPRAVPPADLPASARPIAAEPPIGIVAGRLPPSVSASKDHAAVERPAEVELEVVVLERRRGIATGIEAHHEIVAPVGRGVGDAGGDEDGIVRPEEPNLCGSLTGTDPKGGRTQYNAVDPGLSRRRARDRTDCECISLQRQEYREEEHLYPAGISGTGVRSRFSESRFMSTCHESPALRDPVHPHSLLNPHLAPAAATIFRAAGSPPPAPGCPPRAAARTGEAPLPPDSSR